MALPPTIPTSFVPRASSSPSRGFRPDFIGAFGFLSYAVLALAVVAAVAVFFYGRVLASSMESKAAELAQAQAAIDPSTVESFVRLRDRLVSSSQLLDKHASFSGFFSALETMLPTTVRFSSLRLTVSEDGKTKVDGVGVARSFNALAAVSDAFSRDGRIKDAIFSSISVSRTDGSVSFAFTASLDPKLIAFTAPVLQPIPQTTATTTATSTLP